MIRWNTEKRKLKELAELENNPRYITQKGFEELGKDLDRVGNFRPLVIDTDNTILAGNQRYRQLLEKFGSDYEVEVTVPERKLTEDERKKVVILDNKHRGSDDYDMLANEYAEVLEDLGFVDVIENTGSDVGEFEQFETDDDERVLIVFVFKSKEERKAVLEKLGQQTNNLDGEILANLVGIN